MILEEETFKKFGYYPKDLKSKSNKRILIKCDKCGIIRESNRENYRDLCLSCAKKEKHLSEETKKKISKSNEGRKAWNKGIPQSEEAKKKNSESNKDRIFSEDSKQKISESRIGKYMGDKCPAWKGGVSFEPYCILFNDEFKERVREYWNRKCVLCNKDEKENGKRLSVHHVTYNKETCCDKSIPLFVPLCLSCHAKTNFDGDYWENVLKCLIYNYNIDGKCFYSKEEMNEIKYIKEIGEKI